MTPEEFTVKMREIAKKAEYIPGRQHGDIEMAHSDADELMEELLISLGYAEGIEIFRKMEKWYA